MTEGQYILSTSQTHQWHHESSDSVEGEIGMLQEELSAKTDKIDDLTLELDELSKICSYQNETIHTLKLEVSKLKSTIKTVKNLLTNPEHYTVRSINESF